MNLHKLLFPAKSARLDSLFTALSAEQIVNTRLEHDNELLRVQVKARTAECADMLTQVDALGVEVERALGEDKPDDPPAQVIGGSVHRPKPSTGYRSPACYEGRVSPDEMCTCRSAQDWCDFCIKRRGTSDEKGERFGSDADAEALAKEHDVPLPIVQTILAVEEFKIEAMVVAVREFYRRVNEAAARGDKADD